MPAAECATGNWWALLNCLEEDRTNTFGKIKQRRDPVRGCLTRWSISEFKKIYAGEKKVAWETSPLTRYFISTRRPSSGKWIRVEETPWHCIYAIPYPSRANCQWNVLCPLAQPPSIFPRVEQEHKSKATQQKATLSITAKVWNPKLSFPGNI